MGFGAFGAFFYVVWESFGPKVLNGLGAEAFSRPLLRRLPFGVCGFDPRLDFAGADECLSE